MTPNVERAIAEDIIPRERDGGVGALWDKFETFTQIPRSTGEEGTMIDYITGWAEEKNFSYEQDAAGNLLVFVPSTPGYEDRPGIILQAHMDMVCLPDEKDADHARNPAKVGVTPVLSADGQWLGTNGTTLGADNGIGLAAALALAEDTSISHGPLALMLTVSEEGGTMGAERMSFESSLAEYTYLLNFDAEDEGKATISSAAGETTIVTLPVEYELGQENQKLVEISTRGLMGGHSGVDIHEHRLNSIKVLGRALAILHGQVEGLRIVSISAGEKTNSIPKSAKAFVAVPRREADKISGIVKNAREDVLKDSVNTMEESFSFDISLSADTHDLTLTEESTLKVISLLGRLPDGVESMSREVAGMVETSTNLALAHMTEGKLEIHMLSRSSVDEKLSEMGAKIARVAQENGAVAVHVDRFSGWPPNHNSLINAIAQEAWANVTGEKLEMFMDHAGLECGAIMGKYPHLEAIAIGPTIKDAHNKTERVHVGSVRNFYVFAKTILNSGAASL